MQVAGLHALFRTAVARPAARLRDAGPGAVDVGITLLVLAAVTMPFVVPRGPELPPATWGAYGLTALGVLPLVWRRRAPVAVLLATLVAGALYKFTVDGPGQPLPYAGLIALYTVATLSSPPKRLAMAALVTAVIFPSVALNTGQARELLFSLFVFAAAYAFGRLTHTRQAYVRAVEDRARQLEVTRRIEAEQAAARERARIAREMHDILSHAVSLMIVQAEAGPVTVRTAPERAEAAFDAIAETGRDAMVQLRRMLGLLRETPPAPGGHSGDGPAAGAPGQDPPPPSPPARGPAVTADAPRDPQPSVAALPGLVARVSGSGLAVDFAAAGEVRSLPLDTEATVYRIVQEALTNVVRHADADTVTVRLEYGPDLLTVTVTDDGRGPDDERDPGAARPPATRSVGGGHGLIGVRERAAAHGGTASTGPGPGGRGFRLRVRLPLRRLPLPPPLPLPPVTSHEGVGS